MKHRIALLVVCIMSSCGWCLAQTTYKGLTPGKSTRVEVDRVLGQPVKSHSETLLEYQPQSMTGRIFVQYRERSTVIERIEMVCQTETTTCDDLLRSLSLKVPEDADADNIEDQNWKSLYGSPLFIRTMGAIANITSNSTPVSRVSFFSRDLYEAEFATAKEAAVTNPAGSTLLNRKVIENPEPTYPAAAKASKTFGWVSVRVTVDEDGRVIERSVISGPPLLRSAAAEAAKHARLRPKLLSGRPTKVTGTLIYNFKL